MTSLDSTSYPSPRKRLFHQALDHVDYRVAITDDAPEIARLFQTFFGEAHYQDRGIIYDLDKATAWIKGVVDDESCLHIVAVHDDKIVGAVSYSLDGTFCVKPVAVMHMVYVLKAHRRSAIGRVLIALATDMAKGDGACAFHAPIASEMDEQRSLVNLFGHAGHAHYRFTDGAFRHGWQEQARQFRSSTTATSRGRPPRKRRASSGCRPG
jgi:L-amino acid N-acyltransferase YncA